MAYTYSYVIPVYNAEKYIARCLESIIGQTGGKTEIILINDGSTDSSDDICRSYAKKHEYIQYFAKKNEGQGVARGFGIPYATGEYILFVDSDDYIDEDTIKVLDNYLNDLKSTADILEFGYRTVSDATSEIIESFSLQPVKIYGSNILKQFVTNNGRSSLWNKAFKRELFHDITHLPYRHLEDRALNIQLMANAKTMLTVSDVLYNYCIRAESTVREVFTEKKIDSVHSCIFIAEYVKKIDAVLSDFCYYEVCAQVALNYCALNSSGLANKKVLARFLRHTFKKARKKISNIHIPAKKASMNRRIMILLFCLSPLLCCTAFRIAVTPSENGDKLVFKKLFTNRKSV